jgi:hypothetical protein
MYTDNGEYELFSQEAKSGSGEKANAGDFFKVDKAGYPYPNKWDWFLANHRHIDADSYEQLPKPMDAWETTEPVTPEIDFLINHKGLKLSPDTPEQYFGAELWGAWLTAASDAVLVFYSVTRDENGVITDTYEYDTYGKMIAHTSDTYAMFGYNGRDGVITDDNGLIYMRAMKERCV